MKLGKLAARPEAPKLMLRDYLPSSLPTPPAEIGHDNLVPVWPMYANDQYGNCVWAAAGHETEVFTAEAGHEATFSDANILAAYSAVTGFNPEDPSSDQGTDVTQALAYRHATGIADATGGVHRISAYAGLNLNKLLDELAVSTWWFSATEIGIQFPDYAMDLFNAGEAWDFQPGQQYQLQGGHDIPVVARHNGLWYAPTWGRLQPITDAFLLEFCDEAWAIFDDEMLIKGQSLEGFSGTALTNDMRQFAQSS